MLSHIGEDSVYAVIIELPASTDKRIEQMKKNPDMKKWMTKLNRHVQQLNALIYANRNNK